MDRLYEEDLVGRALREGGVRGLRPQYYRQRKEEYSRLLEGSLTRLRAALLRLRAVEDVSGNRSTKGTRTPRTR